MTARAGELEREAALCVEVAWAPVGGEAASGEAAPLWRQRCAGSVLRVADRAREDEGLGLVMLPWGDEVVFQRGARGWVVYAQRTTTAMINGLRLVEGQARMFGVGDVLSGASSYLGRWNRVVFYVTRVPDARDAREEGEQVVLGALSAQPVLAVVQAAAQAAAAPLGSGEVLSGALDAVWQMTRGPDLEQPVRAVLASLSARQAAHSAATPLPPCPCGAWERWAATLPAGRAGWARALSAWERGLAEVEPAGGWLALGCPVQGALQVSGAALNTLVPVRCAQHIDRHEAPAGEAWAATPCLAPERKRALARGWRAERVGAVLEVRAFGGGRGEGRAEQYRAGDALEGMGPGLRYTQRAAVVLRVWAVGAPERALELSDAPVWVSTSGDVVPATHDALGASQEGCMVRLVGVEAAGRAARAEVRWRSGRRREVRVAQRVEDGLEVWAVGGGVRCALERWPQADWLAEATPEDAEALDAHAVLARLRALLVDASGARDAWRDVLHCANVSRRYGVSEVAADVIEGHAPRWPPPWDAPPCACGAWRVWLAHHMPREGWQARRMIEAMGDPELRGLCPARWALLPVGRDGRPNGPARLLGCASWLGRGGPGRGVQLWSERVHDTPSPPAGARWRYAWSEHKARLERVAGEAGDALTVHGVEVSRVTLAPDLRLGLGDAAVRVVPAHRCLVVSLEHGDLGGVRTYTYTQDRVVFGASPDSDVVFSEATVRPTHAEARWRAGRWELHADATAPPLKINGKRVRRRALRATDVLRLGAWSITFPGVG